MTIFVEETRTNLGCDVVRRPTERSGFVLCRDVLFAHAKICYFDVSRTVQHNIIQLQISVDKQTYARQMRQFSQVDRNAPEPESYL